MTYRCAPLLPVRFPLVKRLYQSIYPAGKPKKDEIIWTIENNMSLCGAIRFRQQDDYQLLTGLVIIPSLRKKKLAHTLINACRSQIETTPCFCFSFRYLVPFYQQHHFVVIDVNELPPSLMTKFHRYCLSGKDLVPLQWRG